MSKRGPGAGSKVYKREWSGAGGRERESVRMAVVRSIFFRCLSVGRRARVWACRAGGGAAEAAAEVRAVDTAAVAREAERAAEARAAVRAVETMAAAMEAAARAAARAAERAAASRVEAGSVMARVAKTVVAVRAEAREATEMAAAAREAVTRMVGREMV